MRVLVTGATGFIGSHIVNALQAANHTVIACARDRDRCMRLHPETTVLSCDYTRDVTASDWLPRLKDIDVVINAVGINTESGRNRFEVIHVKGSKALFDACAQAKTPHIIHISALGVSAESTTPCNRTKCTADEYLLSLGIPAVVLRPSWIYGKGSRGFELMSAFAALPKIPVMGERNHLAQPLAIVDFSRACATLAGNHTLDGKVVEAGGPDKISLRDMQLQLRNWLGMQMTTELAIPEKFVRRAAKLGDYFFKGPINCANFDMLTRDNITDDARLWQATAIEPRTFAQSLLANPSTRAEKQYSNLFFLLPLLRLSLALLWMATALITGFLTPHQQSLELFYESGITGLPADEVLFCASLLTDFLLGLTLLFNWRLRLFGTIQIALILFYTLFITFGAPHWWLHPFGPLLKNIPLIAATLVVMAASKK